MSTYVIGDIQGCLQDLRALLDVVQFNAPRDRLWFTGDLINRGPESAQTLRFIRGLGDAAITVLGNHDLYMLVLAEGYGKLHQGDTMQSILDEPDASALLEWLRTRPLAYAEGNYLLVHAGVLPQWDQEQVISLAGEVEVLLADNNLPWDDMRGNQPSSWSADLKGAERWRIIINALTRIRFITPLSEGAMMNFTEKLDTAPPRHIAWYEEEQRATRDTHVLFGHWAGRGLVLNEYVSGLDSGCVWGRQLTAMRLEDKRIFQVPCQCGEG